MTASLVDKRYFKFIFFFVLFGSFFYLYFDYFKEDPLLGRDDNVLITPLMNVVSLEDYFQKVSANIIWDVQPLRDLTFWVNIKARYVFNYSSFHLTNYIIFCFMVFFVFALFEILFQNKYFPFVFSILFAVHPLMVSSVGWVSGRKHSLAVLFLLVGLVDFFRKKELTVKVIVFYLLSLLSHQILILFPAWIYFYSKIKNINLNKKNFFTMLFLGAIILSVAFYKTFLINQGNVIYGETTSYQANVSRFILSLSRSFVLVFFPKAIAATYYQGSVWNLIGIPLGVILTFFLIKIQRTKRDISLWLFLAFLSFLPTGIAFVNDTYLYIFLISFLISMAYFVSSIESKFFLTMTKVLGFIYFSLFLFKTIEAAPMWMSNAKLWQYSYINEKSPYNAIILSGYLKDRKTSIELLIWGGDHFDLSKNNEFAHFFSSKIFHASTISREEKIKIFRRNYFPIIFLDMYLALLMIQGQGDEVKIGAEKIKEIKHWWNDKNISLPLYQTIVLSNLKKSCENDASKEFICKDLGIEYQKKVK
jgi:hypothetical protein